MTALTNRSIATDRGDFSFRVLVAADGSQSVVRRHVGLPSKFGIGLYYEVPQRSDEVLFQFRPGIIRSGYLWVFPHRDCTNVGIGFNPDTLTAGLAKVILQQYMKERGFAANGARLKGGTINHLYRGHRFGNIFLADMALETGQELTAHGHPGFGTALVRRALQWLEARQPDERTFYVMFRHALALYELGDYATSLAMTDSLPGSTEILAKGLRARVAAAAGDTALALRLDRDLEAMGIHRLGANTLERAFLAARLGDRDRTVALLQEAFSQGQGFSIRWRLHWLTDTRPLRGYEPFERLITPEG